jgi:DNA polymerase I
MLSQFKEIWLVDFEFQASDGERPIPHCMVAREFRSGQLLKIWLGGDNAPKTCPIPTGTDVLFVAYFASAELGCFRALGWPTPARVLDLFCEFRSLTNGLSTICGDGLLGALAWFGLDSIDAGEKEEFRQLAMRGGPYLDKERDDLLDYCQSDVDSLMSLLPKMEPHIDIFRGLSHGRYMAAVAEMEWEGIPIDQVALARLQDHWQALQARLIESLNSDWDLYDGTTFKMSKWELFLSRNEIPWPRLASGKLAMDDETFRQMAKRFPDQIGPVRELRLTLAKMRLNELPVGSDGRNRCLLSPFRSKTGRNQPSNSRFIFGPSAWMRSLIKPHPGKALAYIDWSQQEFAIAAALSGDTAMQDAYLSGDPYLTFARQAGAVPENATKESHPAERNQFKVCALAVQYGMGEESLANSLGEPPIVGRKLLQLHRQTYSTYWRWSQAAVDHAMLFGHLHTVFGWRLNVGDQVNTRSLANFPCQANGAEMLRLACCMIVENDIKLIAPIHDAILIEADAECINEVVSRAQQLMLDAGKVVLDGFELRSDAEVIAYPNRYSDSRGQAFWERVMAVLDDLVTT